MTIKHLVLSGGGPVGLLEYGILKNLSQKKIIKYENIKSIYASSIGSLIGLIYLLQLEWEWIDDFFIKRPWFNIAEINTSSILNIYYSKGLLDSNTIIKVIKPLLLSKCLNIDITLRELYDYTKIDFHIFTTNINKIISVDLNHISSPDLKLYDAITMTSCVPILFKPVYYNNEYYLDAGILINCPINECLKKENCNTTNILALLNDKRKPLLYENNSIDNIDKNSSLISFLIFLLKNIVKKLTILENENNIEIENIINVCLTESTVDINYWFKVLENEDLRKELIDLGIKQSEKFIENYNKFNDISNNKFNDISNNMLNDISNNMLNDISNNMLNDKLLY